jgi:hypothetical protein
MAYRIDIKSAARRHFNAAQELYGVTGGGKQPGCKAVAGYLFGLAGELALKEVMRDSGMTPLPPADRRDDPYYAHFPHLRSMLAGTAHGRRAGELRKLSERPQLFQHWDTDMRYAPTSDIDDAWIAAWKAAAEELIEVMEMG